MNEPATSDVTKTELESLLNRVIDSLEVCLRRNPNVQLSLSQYRNVLLTTFGAYDPTYPVFAQEYQVKTVHQSSRDQLQDFVSQTLADYTTNNTIRLASFEVHGGTPTVTIDELIDRLVDLAVALGVERATDIFMEAVNSQECHYSGYTLLGGVTIDSSIEIYEGVRLIPVREYEQPLPGFAGAPSMPPLGRELESRLVDGAILEESWSLVPRFQHPDSPPSAEASTYHEDHRARENTYGLPISRTDSRFMMRINSTQVEGFNADQYCRALSLVVGHQAYPSVGWRALPLDEFTRIVHGSGMFFASVQQPERRVNLSSDSIHEVRSVYEQLMGVDYSTLKRLDIPIDRLIVSMSRKSQTDQIIDLGIALESLFLPDQMPELKYRLRTRAARHLGASLSDRKEIRKLLGKFYDLRSSAVHTGKLERSISEETAKLLGDTRDLCRDSIFKILSDGFPDWTELELS